MPVHLGTYVNGRRLPLQGRGWGFESLRAYQSQIEISDFGPELLKAKWISDSRSDLRFEIDNSGSHAES